MNHTYGMEAPSTPYRKGFTELAWLWTHPHGTPQTPRGEKLLRLGRAQTLPISGFICMLPNIVCNKPVVSGSLSSLWSVVASYWTWGGGHASPRFVAKLDRSVGNLGTHCLWLVPVMAAGLRDWALHLWGLHQLQGESVRTELTCKTVGIYRELGTCLV